MEDYDIMTREEAEKKMEVLRQIFPIVRLVRGYTVMDLNGKTGAMEGLDKMETAPPCECFAFWQKNEPCRNCISQRMMEEHGQTSKLEFLGREMYQVTARYVEIDGEPYVMEMLQKQDSQNFIDEDGCKKLIGSLMKYNHMVYMDALTGVYNRRYFEDEIKNKTNTAGVAVIDMDYLKVINDTYGHRAGDHAIEMMVNVIRQNIRKTDSLIRYGGDEFLLILPEISKDSFNEKLKMIQEKIHDTAIADYGNLRLSVSIGGVITRDGESIEEAVLRADRLMYFAKDQKNMVITEEKTEYLDETMQEYLRTQTIKPKILIVDDSDMNRELLTEILKQDYEILEAENGEAALKMLEQYGTGIALVMLDLVMPKMDGWEVCREIRKNSKVPIIMLTARSDERDELLGFDLGVDEYISKPFSPKILVARVEAILRRTGQNNPEDVISAGGIVIDKAAHLATVDGKPMELSFKEFELLTYFLENQGIALSREKILNSVWNYDYFGDARTIDTHVKKLRSKMGDKGEYIKTVWGMGYKFEVDE